MTDVETESLQKKLSSLKEKWATSDRTLLAIEEIEKAVRSCAKETRDAIDDFKGEIEDQKYNLAQSSNVEMFVIDLDNLNTAIRNFRTSLEKLLVGSSKECVHCGGSGKQEYTIDFGGIHETIGNCKFCKGTGSSKSASAEVK